MKLQELAETVNAIQRLSRQLQQNDEDQNRVFSQALASLASATMAMDNDRQVTQMTKANQQLFRLATGVIDQSVLAPYITVMKQAITEAVQSDVITTALIEKLSMLLLMKTDAQELLASASRNAIHAPSIETSNALVKALTAAMAIKRIIEQALAAPELELTLYPTKQHSVVALSAEEEELSKRAALSP